MTTKTVSYSGARRSPALESFLQRPAFERQAEAVAAELLHDIKTRGEIAILAAVAKHEGVALSPAELRISDDEFKAAEKHVPSETKAHLKAARDRVADFAKKSLRKDWSSPTPHGGKLGEYYSPFDRVGVYIPGGAAPLASTVIMTATLAQVAGVPEIVACTPGGRDKNVNPAILYAMKIAGVTEAYRIGGIQAIGFMAHGTKRFEPVRKIVGPGGAYVTAAKRQVYGTVALDLVAGPSEIAILADDTAAPEFVAADLLSQAEHGTGSEKSLLVTDSPALAKDVAQELKIQSAALSRAHLIKKVTDNDGVMIALVADLDEGVALINRFAPEHCEVMVKSPMAVVPRITRAGAVFVGPWTPESVGDFAAGPSHVLPTGGAARMFSGLTVDDFRRRTSLVSYTEKDLRDALPIIETFGVIEGLDGHYKSAAIRFRPKPGSNKGRE